MAYMRIHCHHCGGTWEVYQRDDWKDDRARTCPHCFAEIDKQTWEHQIVPAFGAAADANAELIKDHHDKCRPIFTVDFCANHMMNAQDIEERTCPLIAPLAADLPEIFGL